MPTDIARLNLRIKTLREKGLTHALKKAPGSKKRKNKDDAAAAAATTTADEGEAKPKQAETKDTSTKEKPKDTSTKDKTKEKKQDNTGIKNSATASLTKKVLDEQDARNKRRKLAQNENVKSLFHGEGRGPSMQNSRDYMTRGFSIGEK